MFGYVKHSPEVLIQVFKDVGLPFTYWEEAARSIREGYDYASRFNVLFHNLSAPIVTPFALAFTPWEAEALKRPFHLYNNDTNLNGDAGFVPLDPDSKDAIAMCYWNEGHHPREFLSRYKWIGLRNRGKMSYMQEVLYLDYDQKVKYWGDREITRGNTTTESRTGWCVMEWNGFWQVFGVVPLTGILEGYFQEPRWGWKNHLTLHLKNDLMMAVGTNFKIRQRKDD